MFYVYDMGIIDFFQGMHILKNYIRLCASRENIGNPYGCDELTHSPRDLKDFLLKAFLEVKCLETYWEGDIRHDSCIAISAIPIPSGGIPLLSLAFKQDNNGHSFFVSQVKIDFTSISEQWGDITLIEKYKTVNTPILLTYFKQSYDLVENIFNKALQSESKEIVDHLIIVPINDDSKIDKENVFDMKNFERI